MKVESGLVLEGLEHVALTFPDGLHYELGFLTNAGRTTVVSVTGDLTHMDGRKGSFTWDLPDHKRFGKILLPSTMHMRTFVDGKPFEDMTEELVEVEWNPTVPDEAFQMPKLELDLMKYPDGRPGPGSP